MRPTEWVEKRPGFWLYALKQLEAGETQAPNQAGAESAESAQADYEVAWREAAFRAAIPARGPIWPQRIRETPLTDSPGHCSLCGDALPTDPVRRFPRCVPCVRALWLALNETREGVPALAKEAR